jgi:type VI secretion system secreted protein VgrG
MTEPSGAGGSGGPGSGGGPGGGPPDVASGITQGVSSAATAATGAAALESDPVAGATQMATGAAGVAGAAGVEGAEEAGQVIEAASTGVSAVQDLQHDPVGGLLGLVQAAAATAGVAGAAREATQAVSAAAGMAQQASGMISSLTGSSSGSTPAGSSARASAPPAARASRPPPAPASADSPQASWQFTSSDRLHVRYSFSSTAEGAEGWRVRRVVLEERMDRPYEAVLELTNDDTSADPLALLGQPAVLSIERHTTRDVQGVIRRVERGQSGQGQSGRSDRSVSARVFLVPALWTLSQSRTTRIFQEKKVTEILQEVLEAGLGPFQREVQLDLQGTYQAREYCVQWEESDLDFCHRLMQEEGIWYHFDHSGDAEKMVLGDSASSFEGLETQDGNPVPYTPVGQGSSPVEAVMELLSGRQLVPNKAVVREYDWTRPATEFKGEAELSGDAAASADEPAMEEYVHGPSVHFSQYSSPAFAGNDANFQASMMKARRQTEIEVARATSELTLASPGLRFELTGHPHAELDREWLVVAVRHEGEGASDGGGEGGVEYVNHLELIPADVDWRPRRTQWKRRVHSVLTATVVGPSGEEIYTDVHGRIKVQFHWDREGQKDEHSSCFLRSMQPWAGQGWGFVFLPRIGMEVVVTFVDGDIDRPLVIGTVYHGTNTPPYPLPDDKTKSTIKSNSTPGGDGFNELRFEDAAGHEEIFIHAQKDMNEKVLHDHSQSVDNNQSITVGGNQTESVSGNQTHSVEGDRRATVTKNETLHVEKDRTRTVTGNDRTTITGTRRVEVAKRNDEIYQKGRQVDVTEWDILNVLSGANRTVHVTGQYNTTADQKFNVQQAQTQILMENKIHAQSDGVVELVVGSNFVKVDPAGKISLSASSEISLTCGSASLKLKSDGTIEIGGPQKISLTGAGQNSIEVAPAGVTVSGVGITSNAIGEHNIIGAIVRIN